MSWTLSESCATAQQKIIDQMNLWDNEVTTHTEYDFYDDDVHGDVDHDHDDDYGDALDEYFDCSGLRDKA